jgi:predicted kinase
MQLIVLTGLPGTGKSSVAEALGRALAIPVFSKDWLEAVLLRCALRPAEDDALGIGHAGYELLTSLARRQLQLGQPAILDSVASTASIHAQWRGLAAEYQAGWRVIECVCSDRTLHQSRLAARERGIPGWPELSWSEVERVAEYYEPWQEPRLTLNMCDPLPENIAVAIRYVREPGR